MGLRLHELDNVVIFDGVCNQEFGIVPAPELKARFIP